MKINLKRVESAPYIFGHKIVVFAVTLWFISGKQNKALQQKILQQTDTQQQMSNSATHFIILE